MHLLAFTALFAGATALRVCHHNDFHARYTEVNRFNSQCSEQDALEGECFSSIARIKKAMDDLQCDLRISAGDFVQGSVYDTIFGSEIAIDSYNAVGYDIAVLGNHEFNKGPKPIYETVMKTPNTNWITSNVEFTAAPQNFNTSSFVDAAGICWVSALTQATAEISRPGETVIISKPSTAIKKSLAMCSQTDNVVAVTHVGYEQDIELCKSVPELDLVIGGHSHTDLAQGLYPTRVERDGSVCWVVQAYAFGRYVGALDISFGEGAIEFQGQFYVPLDYRVAMDAAVSAIVADYTTRLSESINENVGVATTPIDGSRESCRSMECQMGNLASDAMLAYAGPKQGAIACIQNGGGIRASIDEGDVTIEEVLTAFPFGNVHAVIELPGAGILSALENGFRAVGDSEINGRFPQVGGLAVEVNYLAADGKKVKKVTIAGEDLVADRMYKIVTNSYLASGGDGYTWEGATFFELSGIGLDTLVGEYIAKNSPYKPFTEGRIVNVAEN